MINKKRFKILFLVLAIFLFVHAGTTLARNPHKFTGHYELKSNSKMLSGSMDIKMVSYDVAEMSISTINNQVTCFVEKTKKTVVKDVIHFKKPTDRCDFNVQLSNVQLSNGNAVIKQDGDCGYCGINASLNGTYKKVSNKPEFKP